MKHIHHKIPKSRGGTDDEWNLVEVDPYTHAYEHALDFVLFEHAPQFDFRHEAWTLLPEDLKKAVLLENKQRAALRHSGKGNPFYGKQHSEESRQKMSLNRTGEKNPFHGKTHSTESLKAISDSRKGKEPWNKGLKTKPMSEETKRKISEASKGRAPWNKGLKKNAS